MTRQGPTFIIAGAPRAGTTWLYELLDRHPDIYMAQPVRPEPKFFLVDEVYARGIQHYFDTWFQGADAYAAAGEKSTNYLESATAAERIHRDLPAIKLIFILREPAHRAYSNWLWSRMNGMEPEEFETALAMEDERERTLPPSSATRGLTRISPAASTPRCCGRTSSGSRASRSSASNSTPSSTRRAHSQRPCSALLA